MKHGKISFKKRNTKNKDRKEKKEKTMRKIWKKEKEGKKDEKNLKKRRKKKELLNEFNGPSFPRLYTPYSVVPCFRVLLLKKIF